MSTSAEPTNDVSLVRPRDEEDVGDDERLLKRPKLTDEEAEIMTENAPLDLTMTVDAHTSGTLTPSSYTYKQENLLPPSRKLLGLPPAPEFPPDGLMHRTLEVDVGISQYIGKGLSQINGIIKQRFTDFMVYEIDMTHNVTHVKSIERPTATLVSAPSPPIVKVDSSEPWPSSFDEVLTGILSKEKVEAVKALFLEGPTPPAPKTVSRAGSPKASPGPSTSTAPISGDSLPVEFTGTKAKRQQGRKDARKGNKEQKAVDNRQVLSDPITSKEQRSQFHKTMRDLFGGKLDTFTDDVKPGEPGARIVIKWAGAGSKGSRRAANDRDHQPYIHFTLQKTNRDTSDVLAYLARMLKVDGKLLTTAGTKDKRGVTCQRVCLKRGRMTVEDVWDRINQAGRRTLTQILEERGERGVRVSDIDYRKGFLQLGMLKGNEFLITLRNVKAASIEVINESMNILKTKGFINYYGMQRFGTASIPTHAIGLAILQSDWAKAVDLILRPRPGEAPEIQEARFAWSAEKNLEKALALMPRRVVAERCLLESFKRMNGDTRNLIGALSSIPRNLRMMYVHAYQSYVWNAIVSERIKRYGLDGPIVGDIVYEEKISDGESDHAPTGRGGRGGYKPQRRPPRKVKVLSWEDLANYTIFDVLMPLPGTDVAYPGGELGELYREFLKLDGLDPSNFNRKQREYSLAGSYRKIVHLPKHVSWETMHYTDPEIPLAQSDEDKLLGLDPPQTDEDGRFLALQIRLQLGTACYATMALREVTKVDTSTHTQTMLTVASEDQQYRGVGFTEDPELMETEMAEEVADEESVVAEIS
ncbi:related to PUS7-pseudouridine synthase [Serendipita indica DSM 11827]|uniref:Related to PUS7-pseudouridine synthase n=1 Tax=Serendipita indica (strain DSM 11827) TaxID=1109443 RepID=G4T5J3_SERID|nr:related to PUS7-pseudouridine synthase [Serendipita indica DSM 11827]